MKKTRQILPVRFLGIEGGGTHTTAVLMDDRGRVLKRAETGPCNLRLVPDRDILRYWKELKKNLTPGVSNAPVAIGAFVAGCRTGTDKSRLLKLLRRVWPHSRHFVGNDTLSAYAAALEDQDGVVLLCGTGSIVRAQHGKSSVLTGGWGHVGGDRGSGYWMGRELLRSLFRAYDSKGTLDSLTQSTLAFLGMNTLEELVQWSLGAPKNEIASLTKVLFRHPGHPSARWIILEAVDLLAADVALAARKAGFHSSEPVHVGLNLGLATHLPLFRKLLMAAIQQKIRGAVVFLSKTEGAVGAARLAANMLKHRNGPKKDGRIPPQAAPNSRSSSAAPLIQRSLSSALTEQRNPRTMDLDRRSIPQLIRTMLHEEMRTIPAIRTQEKLLAEVIEWIVNAFKRNGRLFYAGAGTSGRLGVLDAAECPPTFGTDPDQVQAIMAGGQKAVYQSMEAVEDNADYGRLSIRVRGVRREDVVIGIAASGSTPFVLGALEEAHKIGSKTVLLTFNPKSSFSLPAPFFRKIAIPTGPEVVTGSTRLKAGTATKLVLNMFSTISMIRLGKVKSNLMVDLDPSCEKLHDRAARIYSSLKKVSYAEAWRRLERNRWNLRSLLQSKS